MSEFETLCRVIEDMDPESYGDILLGRTARVLSALSHMTVDGMDGVMVYCDFILCAVSVDGELTESEYGLVKPVIDMILETDTTYEDALRYFHDFGLDEPEGYMETMDHIADLLGTVSPELKEDIILVCMMVCAVDGEICDSEKEWIRQLIE